MSMQSLVLWISLYWLAVTLVLAAAGIVDALRHRRRRPAPRKPTPPNLPTTPWNGQVLPHVEVKHWTEYRSPNQQWLDQWRADQQVVANGHIGDEYNNLIRLSDYRRVAAR